MKSFEVQIYNNSDNPILILRDIMRITSHDNYTEFVYYDKEEGHTISTNMSYIAREANNE